MTDGPAIILFDGVCNLCARTVRFVAPRDPGGRFRFASLQSAPAQALLRQHGIDDPGMTSMILIEDGRAFRKSTAALRIARRLRRLWPVLYVFIVVPPFIRDAVYDFVGRHRYQWFGKRDTCWLPDPELRRRFLEHGIEPPQHEDPPARAAGTRR